MALPLVFACTLLAGGPSPEATKMPEAWVVEGRVSHIPHSHPIQPAKGQTILYVDTVSEGQVVAYLTGDEPPVGAWARFSGTALRFETTSPKPGSKKTFPVKQLTVETVERMPGADETQNLMSAIRRGEVSQEDAEATLNRIGKDALPVLIADLGEATWDAWWLAHRTEPAESEAMRKMLKSMIHEFFERRPIPPAIP